MAAGFPLPGKTMATSFCGIYKPKRRSLQRLHLILYELKPPASLKLVPTLNLGGIPTGSPIPIPTFPLKGKESYLFPIEGNRVWLSMREKSLDTECLSKKAMGLSTISFALNGLSTISFPFKGKVRMGMGDVTRG